MESIRCKNRGKIERKRMNAFRGSFAIIHYMKTHSFLQVAGILALSGMSLHAASVTNIVVTASRVARPIEVIPASATVVDAAALSASGAMTVEGVFRNFPGIDLQGSGLPGQPVRLNLRGLTSGYQSQRVLVLMDGRRLNDSYQGNVEFGLLPVYGLDRVEIVRGPASALYGSNAEGGVIQLFSRHATPGNPYGLLAAAFGDFDTQEYRLEQGAASGRLDYGVSLAHQVTGGYLKNEDGARQDWSAVSGDGNLGVNLGSGSTLRLYTGAYDGFGTDASSEREAHRNYQSAEYRWSDLRGAAPDLVARAYRNGDKEEYDWFYPGKGRYDMQSLGSEVQLSLWANAWNRLTGGGEWRQDSVDIHEVADRIDESTDNAAGFVQDEIEAGDWRFTAGVRYDYAADYHGFWSPRLGALYRVNDDCELFASVNQSHQAPSLSDRYVNVEYMGFEFVGNPNLDPETVTAYEVGFRARPEEAVSVQFSAYYQNMKDSFDFLLAPDGKFRNYNATRSIIYGSEAEARWTMSRGFSSYATISYTEGTYDRFSMPEVEGNRIAYLAPWKASAGLEYRTAAGSMHGLHVRYTDARYADAQNEVKMDDAAVVDWRSRVALREKLFLTLRVQNLLDRDYAELPGVEQPGRWTMVGFEIPM